MKCERFREPWVIPLFNTGKRDILRNNVSLMNVELLLLAEDVSFEWGLVKL